MKKFSRRFKDKTIKEKERVSDSDYGGTDFPEQHYYAPQQGNSMERPSYEVFLSQEDISTENDEPLRPPRAATKRKSGSRHDSSHGSIGRSSQIKDPSNRSTTSSTTADVHHPLDRPGTSASGDLIPPGGTRIPTVDLPPEDPERKDHYDSADQKRTSKPRSKENYAPWMPGDPEQPSQRKGTQNSKRKASGMSSRPSLNSMGLTGPSKYMTMEDHAENMEITSGSSSLGDDLRSVRSVSYQDEVRPTVDVKEESISSTHKFKRLSIWRILCPCCFPKAKKSETVRLLDDSPYGVNDKVF